jgi:hypothetical protein
VFDPAFFESAAAQAAAPIPAALRLADQQRLLTLGGAGAGTHFHCHGTAMLGLIAVLLLIYPQYFRNFLK